MWCSQIQNISSWIANRINYWLCWHILTIQDFIGYKRFKLGIQQKFWVPVDNLYLMILIFSNVKSWLWWHISKSIRSVDSVAITGKSYGTLRYFRFHHEIWKKLWIFNLTIMRKLVLTIQWNCNTLIAKLSSSW